MAARKADAAPPKTADMEKPDPSTEIGQEEYSSALVSAAKPLPAYAEVPGHATATARLPDPPPVTASAAKLEPTAPPVSFATDKPAAAPPQVTVITGTNTAPVQIDALLDFYETGKVQNP